MEEMLGQIWAGVLSIERVGIHDNFFDLGGNSLLAMRVLARLKKATGLRLNPKELTFQTMGQMASYCEAKLGDAPRQKSQVRAGGLLSRIMGAMGSKKTPTH
jgi:acyl carrier protein